MTRKEPASEQQLRDSGLLRPHERLDDLQRGGCRIIQDPEAFCFGMDAVLLAAWVRGRQSARVLDLCAGNGILPILMDARNAGPGMAYTGIELQPEAADMARRSAQINGQQKRIRFLTGDIRKVGGLVPPASFDLATANPPYMKAGAGLTGESTARSIARHETQCTIDDVAQAAAYALRQGGHLYLVHRPHRLADICSALEAAHLALKRMRPVHPYADREANLVLLEAVKGGGSFVHMEAPLILYRAPGEPTAELRAIYGAQAEETC